MPEQMGQGEQDDKKKNQWADGARGHDDSESDENCCPGVAAAVKVSAGQRFCYYQKRWQRKSAYVLLRRPPANYTSAMYARRCSFGYPRGKRRARSFSASKTPP